MHCGDGANQQESIYEKHCRMILYADDLVIVAEDKEELNESLEEF